MGLQLQLRHFVNCSKNGKHAASGKFYECLRFGSSIEASTHELLMKSLHEECLVDWDVLLEKDVNKTWSAHTHGANCGELSG